MKLLFLLFTFLISLDAAYIKFYNHGSAALGDALEGGIFRASLEVLAASEEESSNQYTFTYTVTHTADGVFRRDSSELEPLEITTDADFIPPLSKTVTISANDGKVTALEFSIPDDAYLEENKKFTIKIDFGQETRYNYDSFYTSGLYTGYNAAETVILHENNSLYMDVNISGSEILDENTTEAKYTLSISEPALEDLNITLKLILEEEIDNNTTHIPLPFTYESIYHPDYSFDGFVYELNATILAGDNTVNFTIPIEDDILTENNETYTIKFYEASGGGFEGYNGNSIDTTIVNDDYSLQASFYSSKFDLPFYSQYFNEDENATFFIELNKPVEEKIFFTIQASPSVDNIPVSSTDINMTTQHITLLAGETLLPIVLEIDDDIYDEGGEYFDINLTFYTESNASIVFDTTKLTNKIYDSFTSTNLTLTGIKYETENNISKEYNLTVDNIPLTDIIVPVSLEITTIDTSYYNDDDTLSLIEKEENKAYLEAKIFDYASVNDFPSSFIFTKSREYTYYTYYTYDFNVTIYAGQTTASFNIPLIDDNLAEARERFKISTSTIYDEEMNGGLEYIKSDYLSIYINANDDIEDFRTKSLTVDLNSDGKNELYFSAYSGSSEELSIKIVEQPQSGTIVLIDNAIIYTSNDTTTDVLDSFKIEVTDQNGLSVEKTVIVNTIDPNNITSSVDGTISSQISNESPIYQSWYLDGDTIKHTVIPSGNTSFLKYRISLDNNSSIGFDYATTFETNYTYRNFSFEIDGIEELKVQSDIPSGSFSKELTAGFHTIELIYDSRVLDYGTEIPIILSNFVNIDPTEIFNIGKNNIYTMYFIDSDELNLEILTAPSHGEVHFDKATNTAIYTPSIDYIGTDNFELKVYDPFGASIIKNFNVTVSNSLNTQPIVLDWFLNGNVLEAFKTDTISSRMTFNENTSFSFDYKLNDPLDNLSVSIDGIEVLNFSGTTDMQYFDHTISKGLHLVELKYTTSTGSGIQISNFSNLNPKDFFNIYDRIYFYLEDLDNDNLSIDFTRQPLNGTLYYSAYSKYIRYTANDNFIGQDSFKFSVSDGFGFVDKEIELNVIQKPQWSYENTILKSPGLFNGEYSVFEETITVEDTITFQFEYDTLFTDNNGEFYFEIYDENDFYDDIYITQTSIKQLYSISLEAGSYSIYIYYENYGNNFNDYVRMENITEISNLFDNIAKKQSLNLLQGWNLISANIDIETIPSEISIVWKYVSGKWFAYSPSEITQSLINNNDTIGTINSITNDTALWILSDTNQALTILNNSVSSSSEFAKGWTFAGNVNKIGVSDLTCINSSVVSVWKYKNNEWLLYTEINNTELNSFEYIEANEGFWINCN